MSISHTARLMARGLHAIAFMLILTLALAAMVYTAAAAAGLVPWLTLSITFGDTSYPQAGIVVQTAVTLGLLSLLFFAPTNARIMALERSHRDFHISMDDVARAYHACHAADRAGPFTLSSEFDSVRERLAYLRDHPDLGMLETEVLTLAAQMSQQARKLADVYSDEKIARAKEFLGQRQKEAEDQQERIVDALHVCREIRKWVSQVELEESIVASQLAQLDEQLLTALPALGYVFEQEDRKTNVVTLPQIKPAAE